METKIFSGQILEVKQEVRNGIPVGLISGYIATWDIDRVKDRFIKGAFQKHMTWMQENNITIKFKDHHDRTVGFYPWAGVKEDDRGLFGVAEVNLEVQQGKEAYSLAKQGALTHKSIGYKVIDREYVDGIRDIKESEVWEGSLVDFPANYAADVTEVKYFDADGNEVKTEHILSETKKCITDIKNMGKSDLVKLFRYVLSKDAADYVANFILSGIQIENESVNTATMLKELADKIKQTRENLE
jgi:HK97 family phage prohead protease